MKFIRRDPEAGYLDSWLWLPKKHYHETQIASTFTYIARNGDVIDAWRDERHHFRVPRNFLRPQTLENLRFPIYDLRPPLTKYPKVDLRSSVVLDAREPNKTYQSDSSAALLAAYDGILCLRCGGGKTYIALHTASQLKVPILITVDEASLAEQWIEEIAAVFRLKQKDIGYIGGGKFDWKHQITVAQVKTLAMRAREERLPVEMLHHFGVLIPDEAHVMGAPFFNAAIPPFVCRRWGLSATPEREDGFDSLLRWTLGSVVFSYLTPDLVPEFIFRSLPTTLNFMDKPTWESTHGKNKEFHYGKTYGFLARSNKNGRTDRIVKDVKTALAHNRQVLVLAHSKEMTEILGTHFPEGGVVNGNVKGPERRRRIRECNPVIAIMKVGRQALNKPSLDTLFIVEPFAKKGTLQQTMGRILRIYTGKQRPLVIVYDDVYIKKITALCNKMRSALNKWPANMGGRIKYEIKKT